MDFENILATIQPFVIMFAALFAAFLTAVWVSVIIWTFRDIRARSRDIFAQVLATLMVLLFFPFFPLPGWILYMLLRPRETLSEIYERSLEEEALLQGIEERMACPGCNRRIEEDYMVCPTCHTRLKKACPACGRLLHLRWNICPFCGAVQTTAKAAPALSAQPVPMPVEAGAEAPGLPEPTAAARLEPAWEEQTEQGPEEPTESTVQEQIGPEEDEDAGPEDEGEPEPPDETNSTASDETETLPFEFS